MEALRSWLMDVLAASLLVAVAQTIMPDGAVKQVGRLACGLILFLAVARPVVGVNYSALTDAIRQYQASLAQTQETLTETGEQLTESIIARETEAYIQDKSSALGLTCEIQVDWDRSGEVLVPSRVTVSGPLTGEEQETLTRTLTEDLGVSSDQIIYTDEEEP